MRKFMYTAIPIMLGLLIIILTSCRKLGVAVIQWPPENSHWHPGDIVVVRDESLLRNTYIVKIPNQRKKMEELDKWRLRLFKRESNAAQHAQILNEWRDVYANCMYQGLPMREEPSNLALQVYRFRENEVMKVLSREPGPVSVGNLEGYWYRVLSDGGVEGYVFDYHLRVERIEGNSRTVLNARETGDPELENLLNSTWRPQYYGEMLQRNRIDLTLFRNEYGFFIDKEDQSLSVINADLVLTEKWSEIVPAGHNRYDFLGTGFRITINTVNFISVQYNHSGVEYFEPFIRLHTPVATHINREIGLRKSILNKLIEDGNVFDSQTYGELTLMDTQQFAWIRKSPLISRGLISISTGNTGQIDFNIFPNGTIADSWEGAVRLRFQNGETISFLYNIVTDGLRLLYVPNNSIVENIVITDTLFNPIRIYFTRKKQVSHNTS